MRVLVTGGAGYIGSVATAMLLERGFDVTVLDDCSTGHRDAVVDGAKFIEGSVASEESLASALSGCEAVFHFAAKSLVGESVEKPELYFDVNINGTKNLLKQMSIAKISKLVFSSTAATYGEPEVIPISESAKTEPTSPYGETKLAVDRLITEEAESGLAAISLRYFNVAGAYKSKFGWLAERHNPETHLIPNLLRSTVDNPIKIFGDDWPTKDGTCIRDYIHVADLIEAHILALENLAPGQHQIINLGSGSGYSVAEVISAATKVLERAIPIEITSRRSGDPAVLVADISLAGQALKWSPKFNIEKMVSDTWESANAQYRK